MIYKSWKATRNAMDKIRDLGFEGYFLGDHNYLFRRLA